MSDVADDIEFHSEQLLNKSKTRPLRERMESFASQQESVDIKQLRETITTGEDLSAIVKESRQERI